MSVDAQEKQRSWRSALAATAIDPRRTVTREQMATLGGEATVAAPAALPFGAPSASHLPRIDLRLDAVATDGAEDLVISRLLAEGGMGRVYLADQRSLAREVAVKTVRDPLDRTQVEALIWEGAIAGHLDHPGVTPIHLLGKSVDGQPLLVMKRIVGTRWSDLIEGDDSVWARFPMLPHDRLRAHLEILMEIARTIHFAHTRGVLHLDLKPDNVMIGELGEVYVVDWGVAVPFRSSGVRTGFLGTPIFVPPEVVAGTEAGPWTDVYLLGATLHWVLTRRARHRGDSVLEILASAESSEAWEYGSDVPRELAELANIATSRERARRPADALAFRAAIATHLEHTTSLALARDGERRLAEIEGAPSTEAKLRLAQEARFAFRAALDRWSDGAEAKAGLEQCLVRAAHLELDRENLPAAVELERELARAPKQLVERRRRLERELAARTESAEELRKMRHDADLAQGSRERAQLLIAFVALSLVGLLVMSLVATLGPLRPIEPLVPPLGGLLAFSAAVVWLRRGLLANVAGRRLMLLFFFLIVVLGVHRAATLFLPVDAVAAETRSELFLGATLTFGLGTFVHARLFLAPVVAFVGAVVITFVPDQAELIFNSTAVSILVTLVFLFRRLAPGPREATAGASSESPPSANLPA